MIKMIIKINYNKKIFNEKNDETIIRRTMNEMSYQEERIILVYIIHQQRDLSVGGRVRGRRIV